MEKSIKVSVIIPVYNSEKYIRRTLKSIINQTLSEIEIILVDDESSDNSGKICDEYVKKYKRIKVIHKDRNEGLGMARNSGFKIANGEYVAFLDSDDTIDEDFYEKLYNSAKKYNSDIALGNFKFLKGNGKLEKYENNNLLKEKYEGTEIINHIMKKIFGTDNNYITMSACRAIYKSEMLKKNNILFCSEREFRSEDLIFQIDVIPKCKVISYVQTTYYNYFHDNSNSLTSKYIANRIEKDKKLRNEIVRRLKEQNLYEEMEDGVKWLFNGNVRACIKQEINNPKQEAIRNIKDICNDKLVQEVVRSKFKRTLRQKIFDNLIKIKASKIIYLIIK